MSSKNNYKLCPSCYDVKTDKNHNLYSIDKVKDKYKALREQKINEAIRERVASLGITIEDTDDKASLLEKERIYSEERKKIEYALESFFRSAHSLCFQLTKRYIPKYLSMMRCIDKRFETGEIYIKWDDSPEDEWLILIYNLASD